MFCLPSVQSRGGYVLTIVFMLIYRAFGRYIPLKMSQNVQILTEGASPFAFDPYGKSVKQRNVRQETCSYKAETLPLYAYETPNQPAPRHNF